MRLASITHQGRLRAACVAAQAPSGITLDLLDVPSSRGVLQLIEHLAVGGTLPAVTEQLTLSPTVWRAQRQAPLPRQRRNLFCVGRNYHAHAKELRDTVFKNNQPESWPIVFSKVPECVVADGADVVLPNSASTQIDYEAELAVVIGTGGRNISRAEAMKHVFGYTIVNDVTARDVQMRHAQWHLGKSFDTFCPMGPWIVTADELDGTDTRVRCWVTPAGGAPQLRQDGRTTDLIFDIPTLIETCSRGITLRPGDVIATGTPAGVGMGMTPPQWLRHGDVVRVQIDGIGEIENRFVDEVGA
jgi:2-keto-4-pentenoate hydratase/2-oxohepta-3-ene-1,7-dioic acid hydratase in catechol pathway